MKKYKPTSEEWEQWKDLEYYPWPIFKCHCGCEGKISPISVHKHVGIPLYIVGHAARGKSRTSSQREKYSSAQIGERNSNYRGGKIELTCKYCGTVFPAYLSDNRKFCNPDCSRGYGKENSKPIPGFNEKFPREIRECACGCGETFECIITSKKKYIKGHYRRGRKYSEEHNRRNGESVAATMCRPEMRKRSSENMKKLWDDPEYVKMQMESRGNSPNKAEIFLDNILNDLFPEDWEFVGNGKVTIGGKIPDFINSNGKKKIIELYGDYWHGEDFTGRTKEEEEQRKMFHYAEFGYQTLIVWERELKELPFLYEKLNNFYDE